MKIFGIGRMSHSEPKVLRLVADPAKAIGTTFVPLAFDNENEANQEVKSRGEGFFTVELGTANIPVTA